jgi:hypothetical protein
VNGIPKPVVRERFAGPMLRAIGGMLIWAAHFGFLYGFAGLACARGFGVSLPLAIAAATVLALAASAWLLVEAVRAGLQDFLDWLAATGTALAIVAILWQTLPILLAPRCV